MLKNKSLLLLVVLFGHIATYNTLQSKQRTRSAQPIQLQVQPPILTPQPIVLPAQPPVQQPVQRKQARRPAQRKATPRRQVNRRAKPRQIQQQIPVPVRQPVVVPQPVIPPMQPVQAPIQQSAATAPRLSEFDFNGASVLFTFINQNGKKYLIMSREAHGKDKGTYDDFGGKRDYIGLKVNNIKEAHPVITAARECFEEAILKLSIGMSLPETKKLIDIDNPYTEYVIANESVKYVVYITDFTTHANTFFANYYHAFNTTRSKHSREKDRIAVIEWDTVKTMVNSTPFNTGIVMDAQVLNPLDQTWYTEKITLRPIFVKKLRPFWTGKPYQEGMNKKIRFY